MNNDMRASIDIGSNSTLLLIAKISGEKLTCLDSQSRITSLGKDLDKTQVFHADSLKLTLDALKEFKDICSDYNIKSEDIIITATEASRVAKNAKDFYHKVKTELAMDVKIINAKAEAYYSAKGILFPGNFIKSHIHVLDLGGASAEIIKINTSLKSVAYSFSMPVGGVRASDWVLNNHFDQSMNDIYKLFKEEITSSSTTFLYAVGGTITSISCMLQGLKSYSEDLVNHSKMSVFELESLDCKIKEMAPQTLVELYPYLKKRSESILGGLKSIIQICKWLNVQEIEVLTYGLRYGTLLEGEIKNEFIIE